MASSFPGAIDSFTDPLASSPLNSPSHAGQHQDLNDAVEKIETKLGVGASPASAAANGMSLVANGSGSTTWAHSGGLVFVKSQTVTSGAGVGSVTVTSAFSSEYDNYFITWTGGTITVNDQAVKLFMGSTSTNVHSNTLMYSSYTSVGYQQAVASSAGSWNWIGFGGTSGATVMVHLYAPNLAQPTRMTSEGYITTTAGGRNMGIVNNTTQYTSFTLTPESNNMVGGVITVYGYRKA